MSAAVCLLASLLTCPYPDTGARLRPSTEHTQSIKRERLGNPPPPIVARFGPDERFGPTDPQIPIPFIFSRLDENQELEHQEPRDKKRKKIEVSSVDKPKQQLKTRTKIIVKTTETKTVETAYTRTDPAQGTVATVLSVRYPQRRHPHPIPTYLQCVRYRHGETRIPGSHTRGQDAPGASGSGPASGQTGITRQLWCQIISRRPGCDAGHATHRRQARLLDQAAI